MQALLHPRAGALLACLRSHARGVDGRSQVLDPTDGGAIVLGYRDKPALVALAGRAEAATADGDLAGRLQIEWSQAGEELVVRGHMCAGAGHWRTAEPRLHRAVVTCVAAEWAMGKHLPLCGGPEQLRLPLQAARLPSRPRIVTAPRPPPPPQHQMSPLPFRFAPGYSPISIVSVPPSREFFPAHAPFLLLPVRPRTGRAGQSGSSRWMSAARSARLDRSPTSIAHSSAPSSP